MVKSNANMCIIQETKLGGTDMHMLREVSPFHFVEGVSLLSNGASRVFGYFGMLPKLRWWIIGWVSSLSLC